MRFVMLQIHEYDDDDNYYDDVNRQIKEDNSRTTLFLLFVPAISTVVVAVTKPSARNTWASRRLTPAPHLSIWTDGYYTNKRANKQAPFYRQLREAHTSVFRLLRERF